jgi:hypothetical protein
MGAQDGPLRRKPPKGEAESNAAVDKNFLGVERTTQRNAQRLGPRSTFDAKFGGAVVRQVSEGVLQSAGSDCERHRWALRITAQVHADVRGNPQAIAARPVRRLACYRPTSSWTKPNASVRAAFALSLWGIKNGELATLTDLKEPAADESFGIGTCGDRQA